MTLPPPPPGFREAGSPRSSATTLPPPPPGFRLPPAQSTPDAYVPPATDTPPEPAPDFVQPPSVDELAKLGGEGEEKGPDLQGYEPTMADGPREPESKTASPDFARLTKRFGASAANYVGRAMTNINPSGSTGSGSFGMSQPLMKPSASDKPLVDVGPPVDFWDKVADTAGSLLPQTAEFLGLNALLPGAGLAKAALKAPSIAGKVAKAGASIARTAGIFETQSLAQGNEPGKGAELGGAFGAIELIPGASIPARLGKTVLESITLERATAMEGGDEQDRAIAFMLPWAIKGGSKLAGGIAKVLKGGATLPDKPSRADMAKLGVESPMSADQRTAFAQAARKAAEMIKQREAEAQQKPQESSPIATGEPQTLIEPPTPANIPPRATEGLRSRPGAIEPPVDQPAGARKPIGELFDKAEQLPPEPSSNPGQLAPEPPTEAAWREANPEPPVRPIDRRGTKAREANRAWARELDAVRKARAAWERRQGAEPTPTPTEPRPSEIPNRPEGATSARKAWMEEDSANLGLEELGAPERRSWETVLETAKTRNVDVQATGLAAEVNNNPRALNDVETAGLVIRAAQLKKAHAEVMGRVSRATNPEDVKSISVEAERIEQEFDVLRRALRVSGTEKGRNLAAQKLTIDQDMDLLSVLNRAKAKKGADLTPEQRAGFEEIVKQLEGKQRQITELEAKVKEAEGIEKPADPEWLVKLSSKANDARARIVSKMSTLRSGIDPEMVADFAIIGAEKIARGVKSAADFSRAMAKDFGEGWKKFELHANKLFEAAKAEYFAAFKGETDKLRVKKDNLSKGLKNMQARAGNRGEASLTRKLEAVKKQIDELTQHIENGTLPTPKPRTPVKSSPELDAARAERDSLRKQLAGSEPAERARIEKRIASLNEKLSKPAELPAKKPVKRLTAELERLKFEADQLAKKVNQRVNALKPKSVWQHIAEPFNLARAIITSVDLSAVLRQGGFVAIAHPFRATKSIVPMLEAFASEQSAYKVAKEIESRPNAILYKRNKLYLSEMDGPLSGQEEAFMSRLAGKVPLVNRSQRAYITFLNKLRADSFDTMLTTLTKGGEATAAEQQAIANFINVATGRGNLGSMEPAGVLLNTVFFAPKYVASRFQLLVGEPLYRGSWRTRRMIAGEYAKYLIGVGVVYGLATAAGGVIEDDPRSSDFGKIRIGNTRIDPLSGISQTAVFVSRVVTGKKKTLGGKVAPIRGKDVPYAGEDTSGVAGRFLRSKLAPVIGGIVDVLSGEDVVGEPATISSEAIDLAIPLSMRDIYDTMKAQGIYAGTAISLLGLLGAGIQTYGPRVKQGKSTKKGAKVRLK